MIQRELFAAMTIWLGMAATFVVILVGHARAEDPRVAAAQRAYIARCTAEMASQGMPTQKAEAVCSCVSSGFHAYVQIGVAGDEARYRELMNAQPNPNGSPADQRLFKIMTPCFSR
jgi:hypothetical protein